MTLILHIIVHMHFFDIRNLQIPGPSLYNPEMSQRQNLLILPFLSETIDVPAGCLILYMLLAHQSE